MMTFTENGAISYPADHPLLDLFYHALRSTTESQMREMIRQAWVSKFYEDPAAVELRRLHTLKVLFHLRWCRGGKGERKMFRIAIDELMHMGAEKYVFVNIENIPFFGYWKDLWCLLGTSLEDTMICYYANTLISDLENFGHGKPVTLAAKWAPSEGKELDKKHHAVSKFCKWLGISKVRYRKEIIAPLRKHLRLVESQMCKGDWSSIDYARIPAMARLKYTKAFRVHDNERFNQYMKNVASGKEKMNIKLVYPYQLVEKYLVWGDRYPADEDLDTMWNELVKQTRADLVAAGAELQALAVADLSGSMNGIPMQNSVALTLLWAELCEGKFHGHCYVFSHTARLLKIQGRTLKEKVDFLMKHADIANTNFQAVFDDMLTHAGMWSTPKEQYPQRLYVFTDGQFDHMVDCGGQTHMQLIAQKHQSAGYEIPQIIYWNLRGDTVDFPSSGDREGVAMLSGFSPALMSLIIKGREITPSGLMLAAISDPVFDRVVLPQ